MQATLLIAPIYYVDYVLAMHTTLPVLVIVNCIRIHILNNPSDICIFREQKFFSVALIVFYHIKSYKYILSWILIFLDFQTI